MLTCEGIVDTRQQQHGVGFGPNGARSPKKLPLDPMILTSSSLFFIGS
ncbi:hypothetical protein Ccrd_010633 [Cynara cardunculus var. scolymus]|uniref:Uncharacterized protein n=1 Tax=Cynara cardunculus var. scolymus TaxID=59895 RepID=A0A103YKU1_CYNCS|nr:hypothetical protein Ccrd_010633 [Cynara cardunculus var. scolymus]